MTNEVERFIRIQHLVQSPGRDAEWRTLPNANRVRVWEMSNAEALPEEAADDASPRRFIFHVAYLDGVARGCRVSYMGTVFSVLGVSDSTRLRGIEIKCAPVSTT
jgi:hypothetical protein